MFIGHYAAGFAAKKAAPGVSLGLLFAAVQLPDLLWPIFLLVGAEHVQIDPGNTAFTPLAFTHYPITHSLLTSAGWALVFGLVYWAITRYRRGAVVLGLCVLSHWVLDAVVHRPDLPLFPGSSTLVGLGLWNSVPVTILVEALLFIPAVWLYARATKPRSRKGTYALAGLVMLLVLTYAGNLAGPPPENERALAYAALAGWIAPLWAWWVDRTRVLVPEAGHEV